MIRHVAIFISRAWIVTPISCNFHIVKGIRESRLMILGFVMMMTIVEPSHTFVELDSVRDF